MLQSFVLGRTLAKSLECWVSLGNTLNNMVAEKCSAIFITEDMVTAVIKKIKQRKAGRPSYVVVEMIKAGRKQIVAAITACESDNTWRDVPGDWKDSFTINCYQGKADAKDQGSYRDLSS